MNRIQLLDKSVAEMIAAGEVVERPASAVKELLENAVDAGASAVTLEIKNGGVAFIRVTDNGSGIFKEDIEAAFMRHATSKVRTAGDLEAIGTLGFRGEALASIAAVSKVELITRTEDELSGGRVELEGGVIVARGDAGCPRGTTVIVRELFYNTPARMKFLKKDVSEGNAVAAVAERIALSHPEVSIRFIKDGRVELHTPGDGKVISAVHAAFGREFAQGLIPADYELGGVKVTGFVVKPVNLRPTRNMQNFFLNGRLIRSKTAAAAIEEAYKGSIMAGRFPACVLYLELSPSLVDVNVHPAKIEVRFANEKQIFDAVYYAVKNALARFDPRPELNLGQDAALKTPVFNNPVRAVSQQLRLELSNVPAGAAGMLQSSVRPVYEPVPAGGTAAQAPPEFAPPRIKADIQVKAFTEPPADPEKSPGIAKPAVFRVAGQCFDTYLIVETPGELLLIDKHAAHERVLYEELKKRGGAAAQQLLEPMAVSLAHEEYAVLLENLELVRDAGFEAEDFGGATLLVRAAPAYLDGGDIAPVLAEMAGSLIVGARSLAPLKLDALYHSVACRAAIKGGDKTGPEEAERLVRRVLEFEDIRYCPHGRPVAMVIKRGDIERQFGRT